MEQSIGELLRRFFGATSQFGSLDRDQTLVITLREAAEGCRKRVDVPRRIHCESCSASGEAGAGAVETCHACSGRGRVSMHSQGRTLTMTCEHCNGVGEIVSRRCGDCGGTGRRLIRERLDVTVPPGVKEGQTLRLRGKGDVGGVMADARVGDLLLSIQVREHELLKRRDDDIVVDVSIDAEVAERGGTVQVPGLHGSERVAIPAGSVDGDEIRVAGHGALRFGSPPMPPPLDGVDESPYRGHDDIAGDHRGDLLVRIYVEPRPTSKKARIAIAAALAAAAATALGLLL